MFCSDNLGRAWIGGIEVNAPVGTTGLREQWVNGGDLTTPAYEYDIHADEYGNSNLTSGHYVDMFENYLQHIPIIKQYIAERKKRKKHK